MIAASENVEIELATQSTTLWLGVGDAAEAYRGRSLIPIAKQQILLVLVQPSDLREIPDAASRSVVRATLQYLGLHNRSFTPLA